MQHGTEQNSRLQGKSRINCYHTQGKTMQGEAMQGYARRDRGSKARLGKERKGKARHGKTKSRLETISLSSPSNLHQRQRKDAVRMRERMRRSANVPTINLT